VDQAVASYARLLGFGPSWRGSHPELGTTAALFGLANSLIELVGPRGAAPESEGMRSWLSARGEGLQALAFGTDDAVSCSARLRERGLRATAPQDGEARGVNGSLRQYRALELSARSTRGVALLVVERADVAQLMASGSVAPDQVEALDQVVTSTADPAAAEALYGSGLGIRLAADTLLAGGRMRFFRVGKLTIEVVHDAAARPAALLCWLSADLVVRQSRRGLTRPQQCTRVCFADRRQSAQRRSIDHGSASVSIEGESSTRLQWSVAGRLEKLDEQSLRSVRVIGRTRRRRHWRRVPRRRSHHRTRGRVQATALRGNR
jgi:catechol 2,3-dioxygenase-like lactoylglutathione lyase family enzyme